MSEIAFGKLTRNDMAHFPWLSLNDSPQIAELKADI